MNKKSPLLTFILVILLLAMPKIQFITPVAAVERTPKVALYNDDGVWPEGAVSLRCMFEWMNASVTYVNAEDIKNGILENFDLLCIPGGWTWDYHQSLGELGESKILDFVSNGGAYMGICAGAYFACDYIIWQGGALYYPLGLFPGHGDGPLEAIPWPTYNMTWINIVNRTHPVTKSLPEHMCILYYGGPAFHPYEGADVTILGRYDVNGQHPAIVATQYGLGRVFLSGPHPEIEEDDSRDGTWEDDYLDDHGSDWPLLYEAVKWLLWSPEVKVFNVPLGEEIYNVTTFSNSSLTEFNFNQPLKQISFSVNGPPGTGFCNVTIPKRLLNCTSPEEWIVKLDNSQIPASALHIIDNATHTSIYFTYASGISNIKIIGTNLAPESPKDMISPLFIIAILIAVMIGISIAIILRKSFSRQKGK